MAEITRLGARLVTLPPDQLDALELDSDLHEEVVRCRTLQRAARNRQTKRIGKLLRARDHEAIRQACEHVAAANARSGGHRD